MICSIPKAKLFASNDHIPIMAMRQMIWCRWCVFVWFYHLVALSPVFIFIFQLTSWTSKQNIYSSRWEWYRKGGGPCKHCGFSEDRVYIMVLWKPQCLHSGRWGCSCFQPKSWTTPVFESVVRLQHRIWTYNTISLRSTGETGWNPRISHPWNRSK